MAACKGIYVYFLRIFWRVGQKSYSRTLRILVVFVCFYALFSQQGIFGSRGKFDAFADGNGPILPEGGCQKISFHHQLPDFSVQFLDFLVVSLLRASLAGKGDQKFPLAASARMAFSKLQSATTRLSRTFSFSSSFRRLSCSVPIPPYSLRQR